MSNRVLRTSLILVLLATLCGCAVFQSLAVPASMRGLSPADEVAKRLALIPNRTALTSAHLQGGNKMGTTPSNSVLGADHHIWGTDALYVMDSSIFPSSIGANPMQSIYTFAKPLADKWIAESAAIKTRQTESDE